MRSLARRLAIVTICGLTCLPLAWAQPQARFTAARLPVTTQVYLEYQPLVQWNAQGLPLAERLRRSPLFRVVSGFLKTHLPETAQVTDVLASFPFLDGRFMLAVVRKGEISPFESLYRREMAALHQRQLQYALEQSFEAVNLYRRYEKKFPAKLDDLIAKEYLLPQVIPEGALVQLQRQGKNIWVIGQWQLDGRTLDMRWPGSSKGAVASLPVVGGFVLALGCPDAARFNAWAANWALKSEDFRAEGEHWKLSLGDQELFLYFQGGWAYFTNQAALVEPLLATAPVLGEKLSGNSRFIEQTRYLQGSDLELWGFVDLQDVISSSPQLGTKWGLMPEQIRLRSIGLTAASHLDNSGQLEMQMQGFLQWEGLQKQTSSPIPGLEPARRIPPTAESVIWFDISQCLRLLDNVSGEFGGLRAYLATTWTDVEQHLKFPLSRESLASGVQLYLYAEHVDIYARILEELGQIVSLYLGAGGSLEDVSATTGSALSKVPLMGVLEIANPELSLRIQAYLQELCGLGVTSRLSEGVKYSVSENGRCSWTTSNTTQFWANGYTERLLPRIYKTYLGQEPDLSQTPSYKQFQQDRQGEMLFYSHRMLDGEYALIKGMLLLLGSDFRPEAEILGHVRDVHSRLELVSGGLRFRLGLYSEGVKAPQLPQSQEEE